MSAPDDSFAHPDEYFAPDNTTSARLPTKVWAVAYRFVPEGKTRKQRILMAFVQASRAKRQFDTLVKLGVETPELLTGTIAWEATE